MMDFSFIPPEHSPDVNRPQVDANFTAATPLSTPEKQHLCLASAVQGRPKPEMFQRSKIFHKQHEAYESSLYSNDISMKVC